MGGRKETKGRKKAERTTGSFGKRAKRTRKTE